MGMGKERSHSGMGTPFHPPLTAAVGLWDGEVSIGLAPGGCPGLRLRACRFKVSSPTLVARGFLPYAECVRPPLPCPLGASPQMPTPALLSLMAGNWM